MRKFIIGLLLLLSFGASAQWQQTGSKVRYVNGIGIPTKDTAAGVSADSSQILIRPADSSLYVKYKRTWMRVGGGGGSIAGSGTTNYIPKFTSSAAIGNSQIFDNGTNVGIGTTSPGARLQVGGNTSATQLRIFGGTSGTSSPELQLYGASSDNNWTLRGNHNADFSIGQGTFGNYGTQLFTLTAGGNVGIGTTSPAGKLEVASAASNSSVGFNVGTSVSPERGNLFYHTDGTGWKFSIGKFQSSTFTPQMTFQDDGNVGIGTTSPVSRLDVSGTATATNLSVTTNATVWGTLNVNGTTTLGTTNTGAISASSVNAPSGSGTFGNLYSNGIVQMLGVNVKYRNISATYTATTNDDYFINITTGTFTLNLPTAATPYGQVYVIKNSGTGTITVDPNGSQTIDGATTFTMNVQNGSITIIGDGTNWKIVSKYL